MTKTVKLLRFRNWSRFQHYRYRTPTWIKLHVSALNDPELHALEACAFKYMIFAWLLVSDKNGFLPFSDEACAFQLRIPLDKYRQFKELWRSWLEEVEVASDEIASCYQVAPATLCTLYSSYIKDSCIEGGSGGCVAGPPSGEAGTDSPYPSPSAPPTLPDVPPAVHGPPEDKGPLPRPPEPPPIKVIDLDAKKAKLLRTIPQGAQKGDLYRIMVNEVGDRITTSYADWMMWWRSYAPGEIDDLFEFFMADLRSRPDHEWAKSGSRIIRWAIEDVAKKMGKRYNQTAPHQKAKQEVCPACLSPRNGRTDCRNIEACSLHDYLDENGHTKWIMERV